VSRTGIAQARKDDRAHGRPPTVARKAHEIKKLAKKGLSKSAIAKRLSKCWVQMAESMGFAIDFSMCA
jgi:DNA invertase Pin-like site-specific DNA recombinase